MLEIQRHNWSSFQAHGDVSGIPKAINRLQKASDIDEAERAYWNIDHVAVFQGCLFEAAVPVIPCLLSALHQCTQVARPYILELLVQLGSEQEETHEVGDTSSSLSHQCLHELCFGAACYFDLLEHGTMNEKILCIDLVGLCCLHDGSLKSRVEWWFTHLLSQEPPSGMRKLIENWLKELGLQ